MAKYKSDGKDMPKSHWEMVNEGLMKEIREPQDMWYNACRYFEWCDSNPVVTKKTALVGKEAGRKFEVEQPRPYNLKAFCLHSGISEEYLKDIRASQEKSSLWYIVVSKILYLIYIQNYEMAQLDVFNPIFTARVLALDKEDTPVSAITVNVVNGLPSLSNSENEILEKLELENQS